MFMFLDQKNTLFIEGKNLTGTNFSYAVAEVGGIFWNHTYKLLRKKGLGAKNV